MSKKGMIENDMYPRVSFLAPVVGQYFVDKTTIRKAVDMNTLFYDVYGDRYNGNYESYVRRAVLKRAIHSCRRGMHPFIVPVEVDGSVKYFVPTTMKGMNHYIEILNKARVGIKNTVKTKVPYWLSHCKTILREMKKQN